MRRFSCSLTIPKWLCGTNLATVSGWKPTISRSCSSGSSVRLSSSFSRNEPIPCCYNGLAKQLGWTVRRHWTSAVTPFHGSVEIPLDEETTASCNTTWLRENCRCDKCYTATTSQRKVLFHKLSENAMTVREVKSDHDEVVVRWADGHLSVYEKSWIGRMTLRRDSRLTVDRVLWNGKMIADALKAEEQRINFDALMSEEEPVRLLLKSLIRFGVGFVEGCPTSLDATEKAAEMIAFFERTFYGRSWEFSNENMDFKDTAFTNEEIGPHNDGTYFGFPPGLQIFHCLHHDSSGGETILVDGFKCAEILRSKSPGAFQILTKRRLAHDFADPELKNRSQEPVLKVDPATNEMEWIRYNPYDRSAFSAVPQSEMGDIYDALGRLARLVDDPTNTFKIKLKPGTVLYIDNWRVLHGRTSFTGIRRMCGGYLSRDEWRRKARTLDLL